MTGRVSPLLFMLFCITMNAYITRPLFAFAASIQEDIADMHNSGVDLNKANEKGVTMLIAAARNGNVEVVQALTKLRSVNRDILDCVQQTALIAAIKSEHPDIARILVQAGANINIVDKDGQTALMIACSKGYTELVKFLIVKGAHLKAVDTAGFNALTFAASNGHLGCVQALINAGIDLNMRVRQNGYTALAYAAAATKTDLVKALTEAGAAVNKVDLAGVPPIFHLSRNGQSESVSLLIQYGADVNLVSKKLGESPLTGACVSGSLPTVVSLLKAGANVNHQEYDTGLSSLMIAAARGHDDIVMELLRYGADKKQIRFDCKQTAEDHALKNNHVGLAKAIENYQNV